jgi:hypothetical protein
MNLSYNRKRQILAIIATCFIGWFFTFFATHIFPSYSFGLFIWLPIVIGSLSTIIFAYKNDVIKYECRNTSYITLLVFCLGLLSFAFEGLICIIMAAPIGLFFTWIGYLIGYQIIKSKIINTSLVSVLIIILTPVFMGFDYLEKDTNNNLRSVTTSIVIKASKNKVWQSVTEFSTIEEPKDMLFKVGIAYPINAKITGKGVGAIRHCNFSTGSFVEPITDWDEPNMLRFNVSEQPETMKEISVYDLHPNHLHGYFISKHGQFKLTLLPNGSALLEGTTWYYNKIRPNLYWDMWSDFIIHKIHERVLNHIKIESEKI